MGGGPNLAKGELPFRANIPRGSDWSWLEFYDGLKGYTDDPSTASGSKKVGMLVGEYTTGQLDWLSEQGAKILDPEKRSIQSATEVAASGIMAGLPAAKGTVAGMPGGFDKKTLKKLLKDTPDELPKYAGSINLQKQAIPDNLKRLEVEAAKQVKKKVVPWDVSQKLADRLIKDPEKLAALTVKLRRGEALKTSEHLAVRQINANGVHAFKSRIENADIKDANTLLRQMVNEQFKPAMDAASQAGRTLNIYNKEVALNSIGNAFAKLKRGLNKRNLEELKGLNLEDKVQVDNFVKRLPDPKLKDYFYEYWYNSILSGIPTHLVNAVSNTAWMAFQVPHRALTAGVDKLITTLKPGRARTRYFNELLPMMAGMGRGAKRGVKGAKETLLHGKVQDLETKWAQEVGTSLGAFERSPYKAARAVGKVITVPTKGLRAMDVWANSIAYDSEIASIAVRHANEKGLKGLKAKSFIRRFVSDPPPKAHEEAAKFAKYSTFMDDPGFFSSAVIGLRGKIPGARLVVPFVNTIGNLLKRGVEMTPGVGLLLAKGKNPAEVTAKQIEGAIITMYVWSKMEKGKIIGPAPSNKAEREAFYRHDKKAWSIEIGDTMYQYRRAEPFNAVIASAAIAYDKIKNAKDEETKIEIFGNMASDFKDNLIDSGYLQGVSQILNRHGAFKTMPKRMAGSLVPFSGFWRSINRAYEVATEGQAGLYENDWLGTFAQVLPGLSKLATKRVTVWGEEINLQGGIFRQWLPWKWSKGVTDDPTETGLETLGVYPSFPQQTVTYRRQKIRLDDDIYRKFTMASGSKAKKKLDERFSSPSWQERIKLSRRHDRLKTDVAAIIRGARDSYRSKAIEEQLKRMPKIIKRLVH